MCDRAQNEPANPIHARLASGASDGCIDPLSWLKEALETSMTEAT